jgi:dTMP kinase
MAEKKSLKNGILIAIEGIDGAGKTTQARKLCEKLTSSGYSTLLLHEPTNGNWGQKIRELAQNGRNNVTPEEELEYFYQDRIEDVRDNISPALQQKRIVIMDRYYFSNVVYQGNRGLDPSSVEKLNETVAPQPNLVIILDIAPSDSLKRIRDTRKDGPNHFEKEKPLEECRELFKKQFGNRSNVRIIDGDGAQTAVDVARHIWSLVYPIVLTEEL